MVDAVLDERVKTTLRGGSPATIHVAGAAGTVATDTLVDLLKSGFVGGEVMMISSSMEDTLAMGFLRTLRRRLALYLPAPGRKAFHLSLLRKRLIRC